MNEVYNYRSLFRSAEYRLSEEGVAVTEKKFGRFTRFSVPFDTIPVHSSTATWSSKPLLWATVIVTIFFFVALIDQFVGKNPEPAALLLYGALCAVIGIAYFATRITSEVFMFGEDHLSLFRPRADSEQLSSFVKQLQERKFTFFKQRIKRRAGEVPIEELRRYLLHLRESDLVDEASYSELRASLDEMYGKNQPVGFQPRT